MPSVFCFFQSWDILETVLAFGGTACDILDHVKIFFNFLLAKMEYSHHAAITDVKMLWHLFDTEGTKDAYLRSLRSFGFDESHEKNIHLLLGMIYKRQIDVEQKSGTWHSTQSGESDYGNMTKNFEDCLKALVFKCYTKTHTEETADERDKTEDRKKADDNNETGARMKTYGTRIGESVESKNVGKSNEFDIQSVMRTLEKVNFVVPVKDMDRELMKTLAAWRVNDSMREVVRKMMGIVVYTLNVGRDEKNLSIFSRGN